MEKLIRLGILSAIVENLTERTDFDPEKDGVLELFCGDGKLAQALADAGIKKYHGVSVSDDLIKKAKKNLKGYSRRFHQVDKIDEDVLKHKHEIIISAQGACPYDIIPSGQRLIVVTRGEESWGSCCLKLSSEFAKGAKTIQHGDLFLTIGVKA